jgi:hypothetical protein
MFENGLMKKMYRPKGNEVTGDWRRLHNEELHDLYSTGYLSSSVKCAECGSEEVHT